jgi:hypothetical protein
MATAVGILPSSFNDDALVVVSILVTRGPEYARVCLKKLETREKNTKKSLSGPRLFR